MMKRIVLLLLCIGICALALEQDAAKVSAVKSGLVAEAHLKWWGFREDDSTAIIREALSSGVKTLIVDKMESAWVTLPVELPGGLTLVFEDGAEWLAKRGAYMGISDCLVTVRGGRHIRILGKGRGGVLRMWKSDYLKAPYKKAEWRHALSLLSAEDVIVENMRMVSSGGDGIYISRMKGHEQGYCKDVTIRKCVCDDNNRQGISVIGAVNLLIEDTVMSNTRGTAPQAGIDFEPNGPNEPLVNCVMRNCVTQDNASTGYAFYLPNMDSRRSGRYSIRLENCVSRHDGGNGFSFCSRDRRNRGNIWDGTVAFVDCVADNPGKRGLTFTVDMADKVTATVRNMRLLGGGWAEQGKPGKAASQKTAPVVVDYDNQVEGHVGTTIELDNLTIEDTRDIPWLVVYDNACCGVKEYRISGVVSRIINGVSSRIAVNGDYLAGLYPDRRYMQISGWSDAEGRYVVDKPRMDVASSGVRLRNGGTFWFYATAGAPVEFTLNYIVHGNGKRPDVPVMFRYPSGKAVKLGTLSAGTGKGTKSASFWVESALETGICTVSVNVAYNACSLGRSSVACGFIQPSIHGVQFLAPKGTMYFRVAEGNPAASVRITGQLQEGVKAEVIGPDGKVFWSQDDIHACQECFLGDRPAPGVWGIRLGRPATGVYEDCSVRLLGLAPYFGASAEGVPVLVK